jgi:prepilin-type N-terminal cleavage/methylation domain-containing protein
MLRNRKGVTLFEIMTVIVLGAILLAVTVPSVQNARRAAMMESARAQAESYVTTARAIAIRNGGKTQLVKLDNTLMIQADTGTGWITVVQPVPFDGGKVSLKLSVNSIAFDARGLAVGLNDAGEKIYLKDESGSSERKDSVCITRLGGLLDKSCGAAAP